MGDNATMRWGDVIDELAARAGRSTRSLAGQLLVLTVAVATAIDILLLPPSLGNFHDGWLRDRVGAAYGAAIVAEAAGAAAQPEYLLAVVGANEVVLHRPGAPTIRLVSSTPPDAPVRIVDLRKARIVRPMVDGLSVLLRRRREHLRVIAAPYANPALLVEVVLREVDLKGDIFWHARRALLETLIASLAIGLSLYAALLVLVVRRIRRMTSAIEAFGKRPQDATFTLPPDRRDDELGRAEEALERMREDVRAALRQKERLAGLGAAVAKIAHDLRNSLATAQLVSQRLTGSDDPLVRQSAPRLERAIARAVALAEAALDFGKADEPHPVLQDVDVRAALEEAAEEALAPFAGVSWSNAAPPLLARADPDALHRILSNLIRNAAEAMDKADDRRIAACAGADGGMVAIEVADCGPGVALAVRDRLFEPFASRGGLGLGLAIARELARAQGGDVILLDDDGEGARFRVSLPAVTSS